VFFCINLRHEKNFSFYPAAAMLYPKPESIKNPDLQEKIKKSKILLSGRWRNKLFTYKISKERELRQLELQ
jgi:hypothetical protein